MLPGLYGKLELTDIAVSLPIGSKVSPETFLLVGFKKLFSCLRCFSACFAAAKETSGSKIGFIAFIFVL